MEAGVALGGPDNYRRLPIVENLIDAASMAVCESGSHALRWLLAAHWPVVCALANGRAAPLEKATVQRFPHVRSEQLRLGSIRLKRPEYGAEWRR